MRNQVLLSAGNYVEDEIKEDPVEEFKSKNMLSCMALEKS